MAAQANDPWLEIGDPVTADPAPAAPAKIPQAANDPYAGIAEPVSDAHPAALDTSGTQYQAGFADEVGAQPKSKLAHEDEAHLVNLLRAGHDDLAAQFAASKGFDISNAAAVKQARDQTGAVNPDTAYTLPVLKDLPRDLTQGAGMAAARGVADVVPGVGNLTALARTVDAKLGLGGASSNRSLGDEFAYQQDLGAGAEQGDETAHPWARLAGQLFGGLAIPSGLEGAGLQAGSDVLRAGGSMADARAAAFVAVRNRAAKTGATYGAAHGALGATSPEDAITGGVTEAAIGGITGAALPYAGRALAGRAPSAPSEGRMVAEAAARQGIDPLPADVGGPTTRRLTAVAAQSPLGAAPIIKSAQRVADQAQSARDRIAATVGQALDPEAAGDQARRGALSYITSSGNATSAMYRAAENAAGDTRVTPTKALKALDANIADLSQTPGGAPGLSTLQGLRDSLANGDFSVSGVRNMRTVLRDQFIKDGLRGSDIERRVNQVVDAAKDDVVDSLGANGKTAAASLYAKADAAYRDRIGTIDQVLKPIIGTKDAPRSGEQITKSLMSDLQGNNARAARFLNTLPEEEQANTRASIIGSLGKQSAGVQGADGEGFSLSQFLTHWNKIGESAKAAYFGTEARSALNDLAKVAEGSKQAAGYANRSNTGSVIGGLATGASTALGMATLGKTLALQYGAGRLLASPRFARWLARAPRTTLSPEAYAERLTRIARAEPQIANEVLQLQQRLADAFTSSPARLAAQPSGNEPGDAQGNAGQQQPESQGFQP